MGREFERGGSSRGGFSRGGSSFGGSRGAGGFRGGRGGSRGGGAPRNNWDQPPTQVIEAGSVLHPCEEYLVIKNLLPEKVPIFGRPVYLENKTKIGIIDDVFGPINEFMFSMKCDEGVQPSSFKENQKIFMDPYHFLTLDRFLPKPKGEKGASRGGFRGGSSGGFRGGRGGSGGFRGGSSGGFRGGRGGSGGFRGGSDGGFRGGRGGSGGFRGGNRGGFRGN